MAGQRGLRTGRRRTIEVKKITRAQPEVAAVQGLGEKSVVDGDRPTRRSGVRSKHDFRFSRRDWPDNSTRAGRDNLLVTRKNVFARGGNRPRAETDRNRAGRRGGRKHVARPGGGNLDPKTEVLIVAAP